jgi:hypothetical protein
MPMTVTPPALWFVVVTIIVVYPNATAPMSVAMAVTMLGTMVHFTAAIAMVHFLAATATASIALVMHLPGTGATTASCALMAFTTSASASTTAAIIPSGDCRNAERETCGQRQ